MFLVKTSLLKKIGNTINHWRQVTLLMSNSKEYFEIKTYYGRSMKSLELQKVLKYDLAGMAHRDFETIVNDRVLSGYEELELYCIPEQGLRLSSYQPPTYSGKLSTSKMGTQSYIAIPIYWGRRVMIRIGCESIVTVDAICCSTRQPVTIPESIKTGICQSVKLGKFENGIFEALLGKNKVCFIDAAFVNGVSIKGGFTKRNSFLKSIIKESESISISGFTNEINNLTSTNNKKRDLSVRAYICKPEKNSFSNSGEADESCFILKNYYKAFAEVNKLDPKTNTCEITMLNELGYVSVGIAAASTVSQALCDTVVYFTDMVEGKLVNAWVGHEDSSKSTYPPALLSQLDNLQSLWQG